MVEAIAPAIVVLVIAAMTCWGAYRLAPEARAKHRARRELSAQRKKASRARRIVESLDKERRSNDEDERRKAEEVQRNQNETLRDERQGLQKAEQRMQAALQKLAQTRAELASEEQKERATALARLQQDFIHNELMRHSISSARISGIGPALTARLASGGVRTAADFRGTSVSSGGYYGREIAYLVLANGQRIRISGIGPSKARALVSWRTDVENKARAKAPQTLPSSRSQQVQKKYAAKLKQIGVDEQNARRVAQGEANEIRSQSQQRQAKLRTELQNVRVAAMQRRTQLDQQLRQGRTELDSEQWTLARKDREADAYRQITFRRFLAASIGF
jgi:hypothetical protein